MAGSDNQRKNIRNAIVDLLKGNTEAGDNVFASRATAPYEHETPCILVYTLEDTPESTESHPTNFPRTIRVLIEILVQRSTTKDEPMDNADEIAGEVEDILLPNIYLQNPPPHQLQNGPPYDDPGEEICANIYLGPLSESKTSEGRQDVAGLSAEYVVIYEYERKKGQVTPFETGNIKYNLAGKQEPDDQAEDNISLPQ